MASARTSGSQDAASLEHTRRMLDELDALMERMMALPVNELDNPSTHDSSFGDSNFSGTVSATMTILDGAADAPGAAAAQVGAGLEMPLCELAPQPEGAEAGAAYPVDTPIATPSYLTDWEAPTTPETAGANVHPALGMHPDELMPSSVMAMATPAVEPRPMPAWSFWRLCLQPLYWTNRGFDQCTTLLGNHGIWLRRPVGRNTLGIVGLAFMGLAVAWLFKDWLGWTW